MTIGPIITLSISQHQNSYTVKTQYFELRLCEIPANSNLFWVNYYIQR